MPPCKHAAVPPLAEHGRLEDQTAALHKWQEATAEAGTVKVDQEAMAPVGLEIGFVREPELGCLVVAVVVPAARDILHEGDVEVEAERGRREKLVGVGCWLRGVWEEDGKWVGGIVGKVDEPLTCHSFPGCISGEAFGCGAPPEEAILFGSKSKIWVGAGWLVFDFVDVIPGRWVEDVGITMGLALRKDREQSVGGFEGGRTEVEAMKVGQIRLMAGRCGEGPVLEEDPVGVGSCARSAEGAGVPAMEFSCHRGWWTSDGAIVRKGVGE